MKTNTIELNHISSVTDLRHQIMKLNYQREENEMQLKEDLREIYYSLNFSTMIRRTIKNFSEDSELKENALTSTMKVGTSFILDKLMLGKGKGLKSYLLNAALKKVASVLIGKSALSLFPKH